MDRGYRLDAKDLEARIAALQVSAIESELDLLRDAAMGEPEVISRPWRRFLRFSVRGLIVLVLVIGCWLGWIVRSARIQREAVAALERESVWVEYDSEWESGRSTQGQKPAPRGWLVSLLGIDYFSEVTAVGINLRSTPSDLTFVHIGNLTRLQRLSCFEPVSDAEVAHLKGLTSLSYLYVGGSQISDAGLAHLKSLTSLKSLSIGNTRVSNAGLARLRALTKLSSLDLSSTGLTDAGLAQLAGMANLSELWLYNTRDSDVGLAHLSGMTKLSGVNLHRTRVSDAGLTHLKGLAGLRKLYVNDTRVTEAGVKELEQALPNLTIYR